MTQFIIDLSKIKNLALESEKLVIDPQSEQDLLKLFYIKYKLDQYLENVKDAIVNEASSIMPNFKGFVGEEIKATFRSFGAKYKIQDEEKAKDFVTTKITVSPDTKAIDSFVKENNSLPEGIEYNFRIPQLTFNEAELAELFKKKDKQINQTEEVLKIDA